MNILIAEDTPSIRLLLAKVVSKAGHVPYLAENGCQVLEFMQCTAIDMVLMDINMPKMGGLETTRRIREEYDSWLPIIFITASTDDDEYAEALTIGGDGILVKPIKPALVSAQVKAMERIVRSQQELNRINAKLEAMSKQDVLTGVANRNGLYEAVQRELKRSKRRQSPLCLMMIDVDYFKQYNDTYGHLAGDECLQQVAQTVKHQLKRSVDMIARFGGEEFVVLLPDTNLEGGRKIGESLLNAIRQVKIPHEGSPIAEILTVSAGLVANECAIQDYQLNDLLDQADAALYKAKAKGRNCLVSMADKLNSKSPTTQAGF
ncbi:GGDEF domain-containing response regulator [Spartinivicinus poritis]|uniref:diguanylate cyclase n=1 Tax=Spartinivicinus poritis TaxID=2994640 RepID=A0ABT5U7X7_9GAMM|nr:diguanylate cyclase [Spartinivicinus sp. A2-2]MDE1462470.1 diguanylate cyclase [Spartinivicinus sp. A2-2]